MQLWSFTQNQQQKHQPPQSSGSMQGDPQQYRQPQLPLSLDTAPRPNLPADEVQSDLLFDVSWTRSLLEDDMFSSAPSTPIRGAPRQAEDDGSVGEVFSSLSLGGYRGVTHAWCSHVMLLD